MKIVNLTRQPLTLFDTAGETLEISPDPRYVGLVGVGEHQAVKHETGHSFSINTQTVTDVKGMPDPVDDIIYVVPVEIAMALQASRNDVVFPAEDAAVVGTDGSRRHVTHLRRIVSRID